jgi:hypothetical protein
MMTRRVPASAARVCATPLALEEYAMFWAILFAIFSVLFGGLVGWS